MEEMVKDSTVFKNRLRESFDACAHLSNKIESSTDILSILSINPKEVITSVTNAVQDIINKTTSIVTQTITT